MKKLKLLEFVQGMDNNPNISYPAAVDIKNSVAGKNQLPMTNAGIHHNQYTASSEDEEALIYHQNAKHFLHKAYELEKNGKMKKILKKILDSYDKIVK